MGVWIIVIRIVRRVISRSKARVCMKKVRTIHTNVHIDFNCNQEKMRSASTHWLANLMPVEWMWWLVLFSPPLYMHRTLIASMSVGIPLEMGQWALTMPRNWYNSNDGVYYGGVPIEWMVIGWKLMWCRDLLKGGWPASVEDWRNCNNWIECIVIE